MNYSHIFHRNFTVVVERYPPVWCVDQLSWLFLFDSSNVNFHSILHNISTALSL